MRAILSILITLLPFFSSCQQGNSDNGNHKVDDPVKLTDTFKAYWYSGKAEISRYEVSQARYGQSNPGEVVMVFVTEDFLPGKQVKHENNQELQDTKVLKLNKIKRFQTGMYDYSMMMSVFTPLHYKQYPHTLKLSSSSQDWCGQSYLQLNNRNGHYQWQSHSYFQDMVKEDYKTDTAWLEDELWTRLKQNPEDLPSGKIQLIPGTFFKWLRHLKLKPYEAEAQQKPYEGQNFQGENLRQYRVHYPKLDRTLTIVYKEDFPYLIKGWTDKHKSGFGKTAKQLTTVVKHQQTIRNAYWNKNRPQDSAIRQELNLTDFE